MKENAEKVGGLEKLAFALANVGNIPIMTLINSFLLIFYTDVAGINPAVVGTLFIISRVVDGINDPIMGFIIDHLPKTKMGRFRPYIIIGAFLCSINYLLLWFGPIMFPGIKVVIIYISYLLIGITFDLMDIPLNSMIPVMTEDMKQRSSLSSIKGTSYIIGGVVLSVIAPMILQRYQSSLQGYIIIVMVAVLIVICFSTIGALGTKERVQPVKDEKYKFKDLFPMLRQRPVLALFIATLSSGISSAVVAGTNVFFATYILDNRLEVLSVGGLLSLLGMIPGVIAAAAFANKFGKAKIFTISLLIPVVFTLLRLVNITSIPLYYACSLVNAFGQGIMISLMYSIQADNVDYIEYKLNNRAEGALASLNSFVTKAGQGLGGAIPSYILAATGYVAHTKQTGMAYTGMVLITIIIPPIFMLISALVFGIGYNLNNKSMQEVINTLHAKRESK
ncbi:MAG TPA: MFS transporter [Clostridiales bacterium]|nr:MFS transporter [Clostridiales bacterium]